MTSLSANSIENVKQQVDGTLANWMERFEADDLILCFSCPSEENFRLSILPSYKGNRKNLQKPVLLSQLKEVLSESYRTYSRPTLEADDILGILSTHPTLIPGKKIIISEDKDLRSIPGWLWNPRKDASAKQVKEPMADYRHLYQTLIGDTTDGYKGCPGIGPKKASKLIMDSKDTEDAWGAVVKTFEDKGLTEEDALVQARVARILRHTDYDFKTKKVIPWQPKKS